MVLICAPDPFLSAQKRFLNTITTAIKGGGYVDNFVNMKRLGRFFPFPAIWCRIAIALLHNRCAKPGRYSQKRTCSSRVNPHFLGFHKFYRYDRQDANRHCHIENRNNFSADQLITQLTFLPSSRPTNLAANSRTHPRVSPSASRRRRSACRIASGARSGSGRRSVGAPWIEPERAPDAIRQALRRRRDADGLTRG